MERLTFEGNFCDIAQCGCVRGGSFCEAGYCSQRKVWERLKEYEDAEADGRMVVLPCKVGDTVWFADSIRGVYSARVRTFFCGHPSSERGLDSDGGIQMIRTTECDFPFRKFGKTVFFTREEAEKALEARDDG